MNCFDVPEGYRIVLPQTNIYGEILERHTQDGLGNHIAIICNERSWTYQELKNDVDEFADGLRILNVNKGSKILLRSGNLPQTIIALFSSYKIGAIPVWVNSLMKEEELKYVIDNSDCRIALAETALAEPLYNLKCNGYLDVLILTSTSEKTSSNEFSFTEILVKGRKSKRKSSEIVGPDDPAFMLYSSGTTGRPKGILHAHRWIRTVGDPGILQAQYTSDDIVMTSSEFSFMGIFAHCLHFPLYAGSTVCLYNGRASPQQVFEAIQISKATVFMSVASFYRMAISEANLTSGIDISSIRMMISTGEPLGSATYQRWLNNFHVQMIEVYGVSEVELLIGNSPVIEVKPGSIGKLLPGLEVDLLNTELEPVGPNEEGTLMVRRSDPGLFLGYYKRPEKWRQQHRGDWFCTDDVMVRDKDGYYWYRGRNDDLFKSRGYLLSPQEIENALMQHPAVSESAVIGAPDNIIGNRVVAFIVLSANHDCNIQSPRDHIYDFIQNILAPYKRPKEIRFVEEIPKNPVGKILRKRLYELVKLE